MPPKPALLVAQVVLATCSAAPVLAQQLPCASRERALTHVIDQRGETRLAEGEAARGARIELFAGESGTWSLLLTLPDGRSCLLANGTEFTATEGLQPPRGNPA